MNVLRGEIWWAELDPIRGSEQAGTRPVLIFQNDNISRLTPTVLAIPLTTNLRRARMPFCVSISEGNGGLTNSSVVLCNQIRVLDKVRLRGRLGHVDDLTMIEVEDCVLFTMGM